MTVTRFRVDEMDGAAEEQLVRMRLHALAGVRRVDVDLNDRVVAVEHDADAVDVAQALGSLDLGSTELSSQDASVPDASVDPRRERRGLLLALGVHAVFFVGEFLARVIARSLGLIATSAS